MVRIKGVAGMPPGLGPGAIITVLALMKFYNPLVEEIIGMGSKGS